MTGATLAIFAVGATGAQAAPQVARSLPDGIELTAEEAASGLVVLAPGPYKKLSATVRPEGCHDAECEVVATSEWAYDSDPARIEDPQSKVVPLNGSTVTDITESAASPPTAQERAAVARSLARSRRPLVARAAISVYDNGIWRDKLCSAVGTCITWEIRMSSHSYSDSDGWTWGERSRYGRVGSVTCGHTSKGFSFEQSECRSVNDPSKTSYYASDEGVLRSVPHGFIVEGTKKIHRHNTVNASWVWFER